MRLGPGKLIGGLALAAIFAFGAAQSAQAQTTATITTVTNQVGQATITGKVTVGDVLTVTVSDTGLPGGQEPVSYTVRSGDSRRAIALGLAAAINGDTNLSAIGVSAMATVASTNNIVSINSKSPNTTSYATSTSLEATETLALSVNPNAVQDIVIAGTPAANNVIVLLVADSGLQQGANFISYAVQPGDTTSSIANAIAAAVKANKQLAAGGIDATPFSNIVALDSNSPNQTGYTLSGSTSLVGCNVVSGYSGPGILKACGTVDQDPVNHTQTALTALGNRSANPGGQLVPDAVTKLTAASNVTYYVFKNMIEFVGAAASPPSLGGPPSDTISAVGGSPTGVSFIPKAGSTLSPYTVVFEQIGGALTTNDIVPHTAAHEAGHQLDLIYGGGSGNIFSATGAFNKAFKIDMQAMVEEPACSVTASDGTNLAGGNYGQPPGFFFGVQDQNEIYICGGSNGTGIGLNPSSPYSGFSANGSDNLKILQLAFPYFGIILDPKNPVRNQRRELFAEEYAVIAGFPDTIDNNSQPRIGSDGGFFRAAFAGASFACTSLYVRTLASLGQSPTAQDLASFLYQYPQEKIQSGHDAGFYGPGPTIWPCNNKKTTSTYNFGT